MFFSTMFTIQDSLSFLSPNEPPSMKETWYSFNQLGYPAFYFTDETD